MGFFVEKCVLSGPKSRPARLPGAAQLLRNRDLKEQPLKPHQAGVLRQLVTPSTWYVICVYVCCTSTYLHTCIQITRSTCMYVRMYE